MAQPNILLIMADQLAPQFTGTYGHPVVKTPHLDALAARGRRFDAAYCNSPLCAPSRASFMSGQLISNIGAWDNAAEFPATTPTFAHGLARLGYTTCLSGKMHFVGPDQLHGFSERVTTDIYPADFAWTPNWASNETRIDKWYHNMGVVRESGVAMATYQIDYDDEVAFAAKRRLFDLARDQTQPWCMVASFIHPHDPYVARPEWWDLYVDEDIDLPANPDPATDALTDRLRRGIEADKTALSDDELRAARRAYYANVSYFDSKIGELVKTVEEMGQLDDTIIIVTADHGDMLGERGLWFKMTFFEHSARVPLVVAGPGVAPGVSSDPCSLLDIAPTLIELAGGGPETIPTFEGASLANRLGGEDAPEAEAIGEYCAEMAGAPVVMIRRGKWKYIHCDTDPPQLYDLSADPAELTNLAPDPKHQAMVEAFAAEVTTRWDLAALRQDVLESQNQRFAVHAAMETTRATRWDWAPPYDAANAYVRNHSDWTEAAERFRFPRQG